MKLDILDDVLHTNSNISFIIYLKLMKKFLFYLKNIEFYIYGEEED